MYQVLRLRPVLAKTGLSKTTLYARIAEGQFPKPIPLGNAHIVGWLESEVDEWIAKQVRAARALV